MSYSIVKSSFFISDNSLASGIHFIDLKRNLNITSFVLTYFSHLPRKTTPFRSLCWIS